MNLRGLILRVLTDVNFLFGPCRYIKMYHIKWCSFFKKKTSRDPCFVLWSILKCCLTHCFFRTDGSFVVHDVPSGSYVVEVISPAHKFEPVRVDITSKGKMRARYVNYIKPSEVVRLPYPLQMKSSGPPSYFIKRESWGWTDFLMNPMVMMMVLPLLIFVLLPKVVNTSDPDMRREMEQSMNMLNSNHELPDVSEFMTRLFSSKSSSKSGSSSSKAGKSNSGKRR